MNDVLVALTNFTDDIDMDPSNTILLLEDHHYALKTALMLPLEEYVKRNDIKKQELSLYGRYSPSEEIFGLLQIIKHKNMEIFEHLWETCGGLWNEDHLIPVISEMIRAGWCKGLKKLFSLERTAEIYEAMTTNQKKYFYDNLIDI